MDEGRKKFNLFVSMLARANYYFLYQELCLFV